MADQIPWIPTWFDFFKNCVNPLGKNDKHLYTVNSGILLYALCPVVNSGGSMGLNCLFCLFCENKLGFGQKGANNRLEPPLEILYGIYLIQLWYQWQYTRTDVWVTQDMSVR